VEVVAVKCPAHGATLLMGDRHGVEIDYCPECRGIWLDRGELDTIIERAGPTTRSEAGKPHASDHDGGDRSKNGSSGRRKGRFAMLSDLLGGGAED
jgi:Zn-finger nucleic acid-binding protein